MAAATTVISAFIIINSFFFKFQIEMLYKMNENGLTGTYIFQLIDLITTAAADSPLDTLYASMLDIFIR